MIIFTVERAKEEKLEPNFKFPLINNILSHAIIGKQEGKISRKTSAHVTREITSILSRELPFPQ